MLEVLKKRSVLVRPITVIKGIKMIAGQQLPRRRLGHEETTEQAAAHQHPSTHGSCNVCLRRSEETKTDVEAFVETLYLYKKREKNAVIEFDKDFRCRPSLMLKYIMVFFVTKYKVYF